MKGAASNLYKGQKNVKCNNTQLPHPGGWYFSWILHKNYVCQGLLSAPQKNKVVARLGYGRDNRGHQMTLLLKIRANCKVPSLKTITFYLYFFMPGLQRDWTGFPLEGFSCRLHTHTSQFSQINLLTIDLHIQFSDLGPTQVNWVETLYIILARI